MKRTNRAALHAMPTEQLAMFINHADCRNCAYCDEDGARCTIPVNSRIPKKCSEGIAKWLDQEESEFLSHLEDEYEEDD